jgi:CO/xanthine dehydrogenase FAD-binding subunit
MDLVEVREIRVARNRSDLRFDAGVHPLGGGTWLFSEPQPHVTGLVDLTGFGWESVTFTDESLNIAATCTVAELSRLPHSPLFLQCANAFLASFKIWTVSTVGGNICTALPAGPMISLAVALDATLVLWSADSERRMLMADFVLGVQKTALLPGEILRSIEIPWNTISSRSGFRKIALSPLGRSAAVIIARVDPSGSTLFTISAATTRPHQLRFDSPPSASALADAIFTIDDWYSDPHGAPDWRRAMSALLAEELRIELGGF